MSIKLPLFALLVLFCVAAHSQVYKWVDEEGLVHYSDSPPEDAESELLHIKSDAPKHADEAVSQLLERAEERAKRRTEAGQARSAVEHAEAQKRLDLQQRCVHARKQLISLQQRLPVYRDEEGTFRTRSIYDTYDGEREYFDDATRALEIDRIRHDITRNCEHPDDLNEQFLASWERMNSKRCETARAKLIAVERPEARSSRQSIEDARELVEEFCENEN